MPFESDVVAFGRQRLADGSLLSGGCVIWVAARAHQIDPGWLLQLGDGRRGRVSRVIVGPRRQRVHTIGRVAALRGRYGHVIGAGLIRSEGQAVDPIGKLVVVLRPSYGRDGAGAQLCTLVCQGRRDTGPAGQPDQPGTSGPQWEPTEGSVPAHFHRANGT